MDNTLLVLKVKQKNGKEIAFEGEDYFFDSLLGQKNNSTNDFAEEIIDALNIYEEDVENDLEKFLNEIKKIPSMDSVESFEVEQYEYFEDDPCNFEDLKQDYSFLEYDEDEEYFTGTNRYVFVNKGGRLVLSKGASDEGLKKEYKWMKDKIIISTGLDNDDKVEFSELVKANGGIIKSSVVLDTDYVVYNPDYNGETVKLKKARELKARGKNINIITFAEWKKLLE